jgi:hypothetical protein
MKVCAKCKTEKDFDEFHKDKSKNDGRQSYCKKCLTDAAKKDYKENGRKALFIERANERKQELKALLNEIRTHNGCAFCDERELCCMDFHHLDPSQKMSTCHTCANAKARKGCWQRLRNALWFVLIVTGRFMLGC